MKRELVLFASDKASLTVLVSLLFLIALGTVLAQNAPFAFYAGMYGPGPAHIIGVLGLADVYRSPLFLLLAGLLGMNMSFRALKGPLRFPLLAVTCGIGLIIAGFVVSATARREGILPLTVGGAEDVAYTRQGAFRLPFSVRLDAFSAAKEENYTSTLQLMERERLVGGGSVEVNHPLRFRGYSFYQQLYDPRRPLWSGILVVRDPGGMFIVPGLVLLNAGIVLGAVLYRRGRL